MIHKVAAIVIQDNRLLLVRKTGKDIWTNLGGHIEPGETERQALIREIKEEIGCDAHIERKLGDFLAPAAFDNDTLKLSCYLVDLIGNPVISDPELEEYRFIARDWRTVGLQLPVSLTDQVIPRLVSDKLLNWNSSKN